MRSPKRTIASLAVIATAGIAFPFGVSTANAAEVAPASVATSPMATAFGSATQQDKPPVHGQCEDPSCNMSDYFAATYAASQYGAQGAAGTVSQAAMAGLAGGAAGGAVNGLSTGGSLSSALAGAAAGGLAGMAAGAAAQAANNAAAPAAAPQATNGDTAFD